MFTSYHYLINYLKVMSVELRSWYHLISFTSTIKLHYMKSLFVILLSCSSSVLYLLCTWCIFCIVYTVCILGSTHSQFGLRSVINLQINKWMLIYKQGDMFSTETLLQLQKSCYRVNNCVASVQECQQVELFNKEAIKTISKRKFKSTLLL